MPVKSECIVNTALHVDVEITFNDDSVDDHSHQGIISHSYSKRVKALRVQGTTVPLTASNVPVPTGAPTVLVSVATVSHGSTIVIDDLTKTNESSIITEPTTTGTISARNRRNYPIHIELSDGGEVSQHKFSKRTELILSRPESLVLTVDDNAIRADGLRRTLPSHVNSGNPLSVRATHNRSNSTFEIDDNGPETSPTTKAPKSAGKKSKKGR